MPHVHSSAALWAGLLLFSLLGASGAAAQVDVTASDGVPAASYTTLKGAFDAINAGTHSAFIDIGLSGSTIETAPAVLNASGAGGGGGFYHNIDIRPTGGATRSITGAIAAGSPLIDLDGADNVTIDGLNTGGNTLTIANITVSATAGTSTIRFIGGATNNVVTNSTIQGSSSSSVATNGGTIFFSTDAVTTAGNDNNTISNNDIGPAGVGLPSKAILCNGSTGTTAIGNSGIVVDNNNIFDFFAAAVTSAGVATNAGCNTWSITGNRLYQTATRTWTTGALHAPINIQNTTATSGAQGFTITGNIVGFASSSPIGTYTLTGTGTGAKFNGILFNGITGGTLSNVSNNTVANVSLTGVTSSGITSATPFTGIIIVNGLANTNGNTIGRQGSTGSLLYSTSTAFDTDVHGICNFSVDDWNANSNNVGGISVTNSSGPGTFVLAGLRANTGVGKVFNAATNTVGGTLANSLQLTSFGAASQVVGMSTLNAIATWNSNVVRNLTNNNGTGTTATASVIGMALTSATPNQTVTQNTISALTNTNTTLGTVVTGIQFTGGAANLVARNLIHGLTTATNSAAAEVNGIRIAGGTTQYRNNMIAVGAGIANAIGTGSTTGGINGIFEAAGTNNIFHNSIYIGGAPTAGVGPSYAFASTQVTVARSFRDNAAFNARSNAGATGKNYVIRVAGTAPNPAGLTLDNNVELASGTGAVFGFFNSADVPSLEAWKTATGQDNASFSLDPQFLAPAAATPNLHIHPTNVTPIEANGADVGVSDDFDGQTRASLTPTDIGADAGSFNGVADLSITKTDGVTDETPGGSVTYTITASNAGPGGTSATVADTFPGTLTCSWTCVGAGGGTCTSGPVAGNINDAVVLPAGGSVTYTASCNISPAATGSLSNTATVTGAAADPVPGNNSATDNTGLVGSADLVITKTDGVTSVTAGGSTTYTIIASNAGPSNTTATVADTFPATLTCNWICVPGGGTCTAVGSGNINEAVVLPAGGSVIFTANCNISPSATGSLSNTATVTGAASDPAPGNNSATDVDSLTQSDIALSMTVDNASPSLGAAVNFVVTATNNGPSAASGVVVSDLLPEGLSFNSSTPSQGSYNDATGVWTVGALANAASATLTINATVDRADSQVNVASKTAHDQTDPRGSNNTAAVRINGAALTDIEVHQSVDDDTPGAAQAVNFLVTVRNAGSSAATAVTITDNLPAGLAHVSSTPSQGSYVPGTGTWTVGNLAAGASAMLTVQVTNTTPAPVIRTVTKVFANEEDVIEGNDAASVVLNPAGFFADLALTKIATQEPVSSADGFHYVVVVTNLGADGNVGVTMTDDLPAGVTLVSATPSQSSCFGSTPVTCPLGILARGASATIDLLVTKTIAGPATNTASVTSPGASDPDLTNNTNAATTTPVELMSFEVE